MTGYAAAGLLLLSSCGSDDGTAPLTTEEIQMVLLSHSDFPGTAQETREHFGSGLFDFDDHEH